MRVGVVKEIKPDEYRVALTPAGARELVQRGHDVVIETAAGEGSAMQSANAVRIDSHAVATLRYIWESMDAAASVAVPGSAGIAMGAVGLLATRFAAPPSEAS